jgi:hypothetical protein
MANGGNGRWRWGWIAPIIIYVVSSTTAAVWWAASTNATVKLLLNRVDRIEKKIDNLN